MIEVRTGNRTRQVALWGTLFSALGMAALASVNPGPLAAQVARGQAAAAQSQPRFTRIFGSDSMQITNPALSPDGHWIVFNSAAGPGAVNLWVVPASGGAPIQLTSGRYNDWFPGWFPSGDRIAFHSNRPSPSGEERYYVMTIPFDARTGRSAGPAQQVSLEEGAWPVVSPDGRRIVFRVLGSGRLIVVPSAGGTARTVVQVDGGAGAGEWSPDGREIYFPAALRGSNDFHLMRVSADSGQAQPLWSTPGRILALNATARRVLTRPRSDPPGTPVREVSTFEGRHLANLPLPRNMSVGSFGPDGHSVLATVRDVGAAIRVVPVAGGPARTLTEGREYDDLYRWSADATRLAVGTQANGHQTLLDVPIDGGQAAEIAALPEAVGSVLSTDRNHLFYVVGDTATDRRSLWVRRLSDGRTREISRELVYTTPLTNRPGGWPFSGREIIYYERRGDRLELRGCAPDGQPHLLRSFPASPWGDVVSVHGERVAWTEEFGDSSALLVAEGPNGAPQRVAAMHGHVGEPAWSPDGRWIAAGYSAPGASSGYAVFVVGVTPAGQPSAPPRIIPVGRLSASSIKWLPDNLAVTIWAEGDETDIWLVSLREGDPPVNLTRDDSSTMWDYSLSPDGRYIAYPAEIPRGSSIWRIDLQP